MRGSRSKETRDLIYNGDPSGRGELGPEGRRAIQDASIPHFWGPGVWDTIGISESGETLGQDQGSRKQNPWIWDITDGQGPRSPRE